MISSFAGTTTAAAHAQNTAHTIVVGSGKGGVGKSVVSVLLATTLAASGRRVLLLDGDQNLGNLHVLLGVRPMARIESLLHGEITASELVQPVATNLWLVPGASGAESVYALEALDRARLHHQLSTLYEGFDVVVVDAGAGIESVVRAAAMHATRLLVVTAPEPTALIDAHALVKIVSLQLPALPIDVLLNRCLPTDEGHQVYTKFALACDRLLRRRVGYIGSLPEDEMLRVVVRDPYRLLATIQSTEAAQTMKDTLLARLDLPETARSAE